MILSRRWFEFDAFENTQAVRFTQSAYSSQLPTESDIWSGWIVQYESRNKMNRLVGSFEFLSGTVTRRRALFRLCSFQPDLKIQGFIVMRSAPLPDGVPFPGDCFQMMV